MVKEFVINLNNVQDCEFAIDVLKTTTTICELYSVERDGCDIISCVMYINSDEYDKILEAFPVFFNMSYDEYELDKESYDSLVGDKKAVIDDIYELKDIYTKFNELYKRYNICDKN